MLLSLGMGASWPSGSQKYIDQDSRWDEVKIILCTSVQGEGYVPGVIVTLPLACEDGK